MHAAMDVRIFLRVDICHGIDHGLRLRRGGGVVEIDERLAVNGPRQDGEILPYLLDVIRSVRKDVTIHRTASSNHSDTSRLSAFRISSCGAISSASARKASTRRRRASASGIPRERR